MGQKRHARSEWDVSVDFIGAHFGEAMGEAVLEKIGRSGVVVAGEDLLGVDVTVHAADYREAVEKGMAAIRSAIRKAGVPRTVLVERLEAQTSARTHRDLEIPTYPDMLGAAEVAELLGVSKQRVMELRDAGRLPEPISQLRAGPVWVRPAIERFVETWERKPGRPRKAASGGG